MNFQISKFYQLNHHTLIQCYTAAYFYREGIIGSITKTFEKTKKQTGLDANVGNFFRYNLKIAEIVRWDSIGECLHPFPNSNKLNQRFKMNFVTPKVDSDTALVKAKAVD